MPKVILLSSDEQTFPVDVDVARMSTTIKTMLDNLGLNSEGKEEVIPVPNVRGDILKLVIEWAEKHHNDPPSPEPESIYERPGEKISQWDQTFLKIDQAVLFDLILAANFLDIQGLLDVTCKTVANMIKGKNPAGIRRLFNIPNNFSKAEQAEIRKEEEKEMH